MTQELAPATVSRTASRVAARQQAALQVWTGVGLAFAILLALLWWTVRGDRGAVGAVATLAVILVGGPLYIAHNRRLGRRKARLIETASADPELTWILDDGVICGLRGDRRLLHLRAKPSRAELAGDLPVARLLD
jgi:hypothetical protein